MSSFSAESKTCRILYSTQSGRSKACARRVARILYERTEVELQNATGSTFDDAIDDLITFAAGLRQSKEVLLLFVSTTGDGEHTDTISRTWRKL